MARPVADATTRTARWAEFAAQHPAEAATIADRADTDPRMATAHALITGTNRYRAGAIREALHIARKHA